MNTRYAAAALATIAITLPAALWAQNYPAKAIRIIVPFPPGGSTDLTGRVLGAKLARLLASR